MQAILSTLRKDDSLLWGVVFLIVSFGLFTFTSDIYDVSFDFFTGTFFFHYALTLIYLIVVFSRNKRETGRYFKFNSFAHNILLLQLFNISAYALNRSIAVFDISTIWVTVFLLVSNIMLTVYALSGSFKNKYLNHFFLAIAGIAILFHLYESLYVMQLYPITALSFWFFGISLHSFVPLLMMIAHIKVVRRYLKKTEAGDYLPTTLTIWIATLFFLFLFTCRFHEVNQLVDDSFHDSQEAYQDHSLPAWFSLSQKMEKDWISKRALLCGVSYTDAGLWKRRSWGGRFNSRIEHDPLVVIASFFSEGIKIPINDRITILRFLYDERHKTERKLWSGDNLSTSDIVTNVRLYPEYRLAYTEKVFKIHNSRVQRFGRPREALYTFHLPEGAVVTSASLWVEGEERPAYLTTQSKADSAYQTIVGRERRDPLLIHWQEGNRVTARIFPCTPDEDRQFKIGFTTPLRKTGNQLRYENIDFEGPYWKTAEESIHIVCDSELKNLSSPFSFRQDGTNYTYKGYYYSQWSLTFDAPPLSQAAFSFNGKYYRLLPYLPEKESFAPEYYYLDIHSAWSKKECNAIWQQLKNKKVYVYSNHRMIALREENKDALFRQLRKQNFTLFPFHKMVNAESALVISKYSQETPTLDDLHESTFATQSSAFFQKANQPVKVFHLGGEMSPYLSSLQELRCIQAETGDLERLLECLQNHQFWTNQEKDNSIVNRYAGFQIVSGNNRSTAASPAPDHLMRLFVYNNLMRHIGKDYFHKKDREKELIDRAKEAHILSPISSMIVLETQKDYERFDIKESKNSLKNASIEGAGAVPEPSEWLLIILVVLVMLYFSSHQQKRKTQNHSLL